MSYRILAALIFCLALAGCRPQDGRTRVVIWHQKTGAERAFFERAVERYNASHQDHAIDILYRTTEELRNLYIIASVGGKGPDVIFGPSDNVGVLSLTETILPIDSVLSDDYLEEFTDEGVVRWRGTPWMAADQVGNHLALVYNKELLPHVPQTWEQLIPLLKNATRDFDGDGSPDQYGLVWNYREPFFFIPFLTGFGGRVMNENGEPTLNTPAMIKAINFVLELRNKHKVIPRESSYSVAEALFKDGRAAAIINGPWAWSGYGEAGIDYGITRIPKIAATGKWCAPFISAKGYAVNASIDRSKIGYVRQVLTYLTGREMQNAMAQQLSTIPVVPGVEQERFVRESPMLQASIRQMKVGHPMPLAPQLRQVWDGMRGPYQLVMSGDVHPKKGAQLMQKSVEERIADAKL